jgi:sterol desaturase/sphingolipid hydroxylase (fatty acid hydroxylase superfamily)
MDWVHARAALPPHWGPVLGWGLTLVLLAATLEGLVKRWRGQPYDWLACWASLADAVGRRAVDALGLSIATPLLAWVHAHRLTDLPLHGAWAWLGLFLGEELCYWAYHRCAHRVRWFWASHAVHHSPNELTLAAALRLGWTGKLTGTAVFFAPLVWLGFAPAAVLGMLAVNLLYQFWLHATWIPKLGPLEWVFNTPAHHRVHHAANTAYLDCNFGGVLIAFDRLFGSFVAERADLPPRYGLVHPLHSHNPVHIALHEWLNLWRDLRAAPGLMARWRVLCGPPGGASAAAPSTRPPGPQS